MGTGVAEDCARAGYTVALVDVSDERLQAARDALRRAGLVDRLRSPQAEHDNWLERIGFGTDDAQLAGCELVVENVTEDPDTKTAVHRRLDDLCPGVPVIVNTSVIPITWLAGRTSSPERFVGVHFMNPVPAKPLVEVIRGEQTSDASAEAVLDFLRSIGKDWVPVADSPGFVSNAIFMTVINSAAELVEKGVSDVAGVDRVFRECFGHPMGPLESADLIGIDTVVRSLRMLQKFVDVERYEPSCGLTRLVEAGRVGRRVGDGFYQYASGRAGARS
ncbi:3-hydroxyacyl-CoA dehydrogenase family protein [Streptomyces sp. ISL-87]|nr:3-hydroxyacyl-CoA dehydrogenase family protein [Streptomyces sp. ISL-21]MBT2458182.1 3-hydroxyacyl-CoA dehydrogenase family protein [Streptomyces sp. ISL-86]MBT2608729.1 3-hydroxyacyl-CoA dehydrogenase family protein [Streptomyces sp. ISL-87]